MVIMSVTSIKGGLKGIKWYKSEEFSLFNIYCHHFMIIIAMTLKMIFIAKMSLLTALHREKEIFRLF